MKMSRKSAVLFKNPSGLQQLCNSLNKYFIEALTFSASCSGRHKHIFLKTLYNRVVRALFTTKSKVLLLLTAWLRELSFNASSRQFPDVDLWGRLSMGALISQTGRFPYRDIFSYTAAGASWIDHEWLSGLIFYQVLLLGGEWAFIALYALLLLSINILIFSLHTHVYKVSPLWPLYSLLVTADVYSHGFLSTIRCQTFSFVLFCLFILILEGIRLKQWQEHWLLLLIPLATLCATSTGGWQWGSFSWAAIRLAALLQKRVGEKVYSI